MLRKISSCVLMSMLTLLFLTSPAFALFEDEDYKIGGDFRLRQVFFDNIIDCNDDGEDQYNFFRFRLRAFGEFAPTPEFRLYARITGEPRYYIDPDMDDEFNRDEFIFDNLYIEFKGGTDVLSTTRIGRQDIIQGSKLLILDGTPLDGSRTIYVDAIRQMFKLENMNIDLFLSQVKSEDPLPKINDQDMLLTEEDEQVHGILIDGKVAEDVKLEGYYYFHKTDDTEKKSNTLGGRIINQMTEEVSLSGELAYQFGEVGDIDIHNAMAGEVVLTYKPMDMQMTPEFKFSYTYLPGEDPTTEDTEAWDSLYGRWPRFSELYIYTYIQETRVALVNNIQRYTVSCGFVPMENLSAFAAINYLRANENPLQGQRIFGDGEERGWLYVLKAIYKFNDALTGHLWLEYLNPGDYYAEANQDSGYFFRYELMYTF